ncbi:hypothetical protein FACS1894122_07240 [Alphaproteobacteria bacterium]|nr:hypothetical protein FACS1894122_07240 [Alphaproteobacteria bacterium]
MKPEASACEGAKAFEGFTIGAGLNVGVQKTSSEANREFRDASTSVNSTMYGCTVAIGYQKAVSGNFTVGIEVGADIGGASKSVRIGGVIKDDSSIAIAANRDAMAAERDYYKAGEDYLKKERILRQMFHNISSSPNAFGGNYDVDTLASSHIVDVDVYGGFVRSMRYLGGEADFSTGNRNNFMTTPAGGGVFDGAYDANPLAVLADFVGERSINSIRSLGGGDLHDGYDKIREFVGAKFPAISDALGHMAEQPITAADPIFGPSVAHNGNVDTDGNVESGNVHWAVAFQLHKFFAGEYIREYPNIGINPAGRNIEDLRKEIENLYNPNNSDVRPPLNDNEIRAISDFKSKTSFGVCPYAAVKLGYFYKELNACLYAKVGIMQLYGHVAIMNDFIEKSDKFQTFAPLLAVGISKMLNERWGISAEFSHTIKTGKKLKDIEWKGYSIENKVRLSRSSFRLLVTYSF